MASSRFTHVKAWRKAFVHADRWSWNVKGAHCVMEQCSSGRCTCKYTCVSTFRFRFTRTHTHTHWQTSPLLSTAYKHKHTPLPIYPQPCVIHSTATCCDPLDNFYAHMLVICGFQWAFKMGGILEHLLETVLIIPSHK